MSLKKIKSVDIDKYSEYIVCRFIKEVQTLLPTKSFWRIPEPIQHLCLLFYYVIPNDEFVRYHSAMSYDKDENILRHIGSGSYTSFGHIEIHENDPFIYRWTFKILLLYSTHFSTEGNLCIGIISNATNINTQIHCKQNQENKSCKYYGFQSNATGCDHEFSNSFMFGNRMKIDSIVIMELNVPKKSLSFFINNEFQGIIAENVDFSDGAKYNMAVSMQNSVGNISIQLVDFERSIESTFYNIK